MLRSALLVRVIVGALTLGWSHPASKGATAKNPFFVYNFGRLTEMTPLAQVRLLQQLGYDGISLGCESDRDLQGLSGYFSAVDQAGGSFRIFGVYVFYRFDASVAERARWQSVLNRIEGRKIPLWLIIGPGVKGVNDETVAGIIGSVADQAKRTRTDVILYPHSLCYIACAEDALPFLRRLHRSNLGLALHLYHELRAGNIDRLQAVADQVAPYLRFASLAGTDAKVDWTSLVAMDRSTIKPLDEGDYDLRRFLGVLRRIGFDGPIGFNNFKIGEEPADYLARSIRRWHELQREP